MKKVISIVLLLALSQFANASECPDLLKFAKRKLNSQEVVNMCEAYKGKTVLFVNTASKCGFTPQFEGLEALYEKHKEEGLVILGFPSNDFNQEFGDEKKTAELCELTYGVKFPMFESISVRGDDADPLYAMLAKKAGSEPKWNFYKYLMDKNGDVVDSYSAFTKPDNEDFVADIKAALAL
ncbi:glutathione peroxidase [Glaciecola sp.]|jgi:glutathione peroxidase|uniref:glutathione peroxidase n=1 Tax=Glaciecola sp. MF2-115 TaxID=3384827 RepID=UPI003989AF18|mmetsp:Transcript_31765/g.101226  ORF Transcript_31765/g.101226 Transcript_31765/m.101226 type:complete len:181 (-) Transcript_31765:76-618(-)